MVPDTLPGQGNLPVRQSGVVRQTFLDEPAGRENVPVIRVLYVDDEPDLLDLGKVFLEDSGEFIVTTETKATAALQLLEHEQIDAIVSDYQMPYMDGIRFLSEVRARFGRVPFILFTGKGREEVVIQAINNGVDFYLQKGGDPVAQFAELAHKIRQAVHRKTAQDELSAAIEQIAATEEELRSQYDELVISEQRIRESEKMFRELFDMVPLACCVTDMDGHYTLVNERFEETTGYSLSELVGKTGIEMGLIRGDSEEYLENNLAKTGRIDSRELATRRRNGDERNVLVSSRSVSIQQKPHVITAIFDITDRKRIENALRESEDRFRAMIDQSPFAVMVFDPAGNVVHVNDAHLRLWGVTRERAMGFNAFHDPQLETLGLLPAFHRAFMGEHLTIPPLEYDLPSALGTGQKKNVLGDFYPIRNPEGQVTHVILIHHDVTPQT